MSFHPRVWGLVLMDMIRSQISGMSCLSKSLCCTPAANHVGPGNWLGYLPWCFSLVLFRTKPNGRRVRDWRKVCFGCLLGLIVSCFHNGCTKSSACISWWVNYLDTAFTFFFFLPTAETILSFVHLLSRLTQNHIPFSIKLCILLKNSYLFSVQLHRLVSWLTCSLIHTDTHNIFWLNTMCYCFKTLTINGVSMSNSN